MDQWERIHVLVTRPAHQAQGLIVKLSERGASVLSFPTLSIHPILLDDDTQAKLLTLNDMNWVVFISPNAVNYGMPRILPHFDLSHFKPQFAAVGEGTADTLKQFGVKEVLFPENDVGALALLACFPEALHDQKIFIFKGDSDNLTLEHGFRDRGATVDCCVCYQRIHTQEDPQPLLHALIRKGIDIIVTTSGESLRSLQALIPPHMLPDFYQLPLVVVSDHVHEVATSFGFKQLYLSKGASDAAILDTINDWYEHHGGRHD